MQILILGMGNLLLGDEGVGVHAAQALMKEDLGGVVVRDVGTAILDVLPDLEKADRIIVVDAMKSDGAPGTVYRVSLDRCLRSASIGGLHGFDLRAVLALSQREKPPQVTVLGVEPGHIGWSVELSPPVFDALPTLLEAVRKEAGPPNPPRVDGHRKGARLTKD